MSLVTVGTVAFDAIQTPFASSGKIVGGAASYIGLSASQFAKEQHIISVIGDDFPQSFITELESRGINTEGLECRKGEKSFFWEGKYHMDMNSRDTLTTDLNVLADFKPVVPDSAKHSDYVMLGNLDPNVQASVLDQMAKRPKLVVLDTMNFWMDIALEPLKEVLQRIDVLTINDEEARQLSGEYSLVKAAQKYSPWAHPPWSSKRANTVHCSSIRMRFSLLPHCRWRRCWIPPVQETLLPVALSATWRTPTTRRLRT